MREGRTPNRPLPEVHLPSQLRRRSTSPKRGGEGASARSTKGRCLSSGEDRRVRFFTFCRWIGEADMRRHVRLEESIQRAFGTPWATRGGSVPESKAILLFFGGQSMHPYGPLLKRYLRQAPSNRGVLHLPYQW